MAMMMTTRMTILRVRKAIKGVWVVVPFDCYLSVLDLFSFITLSYLYLLRPISSTVFHTHDILTTIVFVRILKLITN